MGAVAVLLTVTGGAWSAPAGAARAPGAGGGALTVSPASGPVGTLVTIEVSPPAQSQGCGQVVLGAPGQTSGGTAVAPTAEPRSEFVIPGFIGAPAQVVHPGTYSVAVSCSAGAPSFAFTTLRATFTVTSTAVSGGRFVGMAATPDSGGYWLAQRGGGVWSFGDAAYRGSLPGLGVTPSSPVVGIAATADGKGYWLVGADGGVFSFGDATFYGSLPDLGVTPVAPVVGIAATTDGKGYWLVGADGGVFAFGDAPYCTPVLVSAPPVLPSGFVAGAVPDVAVAADPSSVGYEQVDNAGAGLVAPWNGQTCEPNTVNANYAQIASFQEVQAPISGIATSPTGAPWLVGIDGGVFAPQVIVSGSVSVPTPAPFFGSLPGLGIRPRAPIVGIAATHTGGGYWLIGSDGGVFAFGDAGFFGSAG